MTSSGSNVHPLLTGWGPSEDKCCGRWSPDGNYAFLGPSPGPRGQILLLTRGAGFSSKNQRAVSIDLRPSQLEPPGFQQGRNENLRQRCHKKRRTGAYRHGISADSVTFSKDGQPVAYLSFPDDILWKANRDGMDRVQLTSPPLRPQSPAWSPDGSQIAFMAWSRQGSHAWIVPSWGGSPQRLLPEDGGQETDPNWSPDGRKIVFTTHADGSSERFIRILDLASRQNHHCSWIGRQILAPLVSRWSIQSAHGKRYNLQLNSKPSALTCPD